MNWLAVGVPIAALVTFVASEWDTLWPKEGRHKGKQKWLPSNRGIVLLLGGLATLVFASYEYHSQSADYETLLLRIAREGERIRPQDFSLRVQSSGHMSAFDPSTQERDLPDTLSFWMSIDDTSRDTQVAFITGELALVPDAASIYGSGGRNPNRYWTYTVRHQLVTFTGLSYFDELNGKTVRLQVPRKTLKEPFKMEARPTIQADIYIQGKHLFGIGDENGLVSIKVD